MKRETGNRLVVEKKMVSLAGGTNKCQIARIPLKKWSFLVD